MEENEKIDRSCPDTSDWDHVPSSLDCEEDSLQSEDEPWFAGSTEEGERDQPMPPLWRFKTPGQKSGGGESPEVTRDEVTGGKVTGGKVTGGKVTGGDGTAGEDRVEAPSPRTAAAVQRLVEARQALKRTLAEPQDVVFPSTVRPYLQALLEVLTGDAAEDFNKLQDSNLQYYWTSTDSFEDICHKRFWVPSKIKEALTHAETSPHIQETMKLLLRIKDRLFRFSIWDPLSAIIFGNLLQVIGSELQVAGSTGDQTDTTQPLRWRLNEDPCMRLASLLQKTVKFLEARENRSREEVEEVDEADEACLQNSYWDPYPTSVIFDMKSVEDSVKLPPSKRAAVEELEKAAERLKRTLAGPRDVPFPSALKSYLQTLLEVLIGDAAKDFQTLQDRNLRYYWLSASSRNKKSHKKLRVASAVLEALTHLRTSAHAEEVLNLLLEVRDKLFSPTLWDPLSSALFSNLLQVIRGELQGTWSKNEKENTPHSRRRLDEDSCLDLTVLLQKTVEFLEVRESRSGEVVMEVDAADQTCWRTWHWDPFPSKETFDWSGVKLRDKDSEEIPFSRTAAVRRLVKARERLRKTLARHKKNKSGAPSILFPSTLKPYFQALLEVLTGEIEEDFQKLHVRFPGPPCFDKKRYTKSRIATAFEEAMRDPQAASHIQEAVNLLVEVKDKLFPPSYWDTRSTILLSNVLQVISEELQANLIRKENEKECQTSGRRLDEDACMDLVSLLQKTGEFLKARENRSREKVLKVDEGDSISWECWYWESPNFSKIIDMRLKARRQEEAAKKLKRILARLEKLWSGTADVPFPSTVRPYLKALLETLTGDAMEDFQKLQDASFGFYLLYTDRLDKTRLRKRKVAAAFKKAMEHAETSSHIGEAAKLLSEVKEKLPHRPESIDNLLQLITEKLQSAESGTKKDSQAFGWWLDEDACMKLGSLLQKSVELLEDSENPSMEEVVEVDEEDLNHSDSLDQHRRLPHRTIDRSEEKFHTWNEEVVEVDEEDLNHSDSLDQHRRRPCRTIDSLWESARKGAMTSAIPKLLGLLLLASLLGGVAASPLPATSRVQGSGRAEQGHAYSLTCEVDSLPGTVTTSSFIWHKDGHVIRNETQQVLTFTRLTQDDAGNYQCTMRLQDKAQSGLSEPFQLHVLVLENVVMVPEVEVEEGETATLNCSVHSVPTARLCWMMDAKILRCVQSNSDSLVLHNVSRLHLKVFHCQASNNEFFKLLGADTQIRIKGTYEVMPKPLLGSEGLPVLHQPFKLVCKQFDFPEHTAHIRLSYIWFKDYRVIPGQSGEELQFSNLTKQDRGMYSCVSRNGKPETSSPESNKKDLRILLPPRVHMEPATTNNVIRRAAGEELTLTCKVTEAIPWVPNNGYSWSYLPSKHGPRRPLGERESTLRLGPLTREDSGQYFCQARNDLDVFQGQIPPGNASVTVDVVYLGNIILTPNLEVNEGDHVTLTCTVDCNSPAYLAWIVHGQEVRHVTDNRDHYVLQRAACSDSKTYTCRASIADVPGFERHASTNLRVACSENVTDLPFPYSSPLNTNQGPHPFLPLWLWVLVLLALLLWALTATVILIYCFNRKFREKVKRAKASLLRRTRAADEQRGQGGQETVPLQGINKEQPDQGSHVVVPLHETGHSQTVPVLKLDLMTPTIKSRVQWRLSVRDQTVTSND